MAVTTTALRTGDERALRILLVDDNLPDRADAKAALIRGSSRRYHFTEAGLASETLQLCRQAAPFDCMVLDFYLPDGDALDVLAGLDCDADGVPHLPVVILTGISGDTSRASLRSGAQDYVGKAWLGPESLTWAVENAIERRKIAREVIGERQAMEEQRQYLFEAERMARQESERVTLLKDEFLATLSHELRTPLAAIVGWASVLQHAQGNPATVQRGIEAIARNGQLQARLIDDLLDVNRVVAGKLVLDLQRVDVHALLVAASDMLRPTALAKGVEMLIEDAQASPLAVRGDAVRLQQILANLLGNALKFTPPGGRISMAVARHGATQLAVTVSDTGEGIAAAFIPHLFDRFSQADGKAARVHGGLGLGLSIVKQLTELHGGSVSGASGGPGCGATFTVLLPVAAEAGGAVDAPGVAQAVAAAGAAGNVASLGSGGNAGTFAEAGYAGAAAIPLSAAVAPMAPPTYIDLQGVRVLLVDDNDDILELSRRVLAECGASVVIVGSVTAALAQLRDVRPHVLVSDISMPVLNGYDLIRTIRSDLQLDAQALPAIAISAYARTLDQQRALHAGYQAYVVKPLQPHLLIQAVARLAGVAGAVA